jgi:hypothetical protein
MRLSTHAAFSFPPRVLGPFSSRAFGVAHFRTAASVSVMPAWRPLAVE